MSKSINNILEQRDQMLAAYSNPHANILRTSREVSIGQEVFVYHDEVWFQARVCSIDGVDIVCHIHALDMDLTKNFRNIATTLYKGNNAIASAEQWAALNLLRSNYLDKEPLKNFTHS